MVTRLLMCAIAAIALSGCASMERQAANDRYDKMMNSFLGTQESFVADRWGAPDQVYETGDSKYLTYVSSRIVPVPSPMLVGTRPLIFPVMYGGSTSLFCKNTFKIKRGVVVSVQYEGNACRA